MSEPNDDSPGFLRQYGPALAIGLIVAGGVAAVAVSMSSDKKSAPPRPQETIVRLSPLPPPPPPPPPKPKEPEEKPETDPKPTEQKMVDQEPVAKAEEKPAETPQPPAPAAEAVGTSLKGDGPNNFGLGYSRTGGGNGVIGGTGAGTGAGSGQVGGSRWGWYAGKVQTQVQSALLANKRTRAAAMRITVRVWANDAGKVTKAQLANGTGDAELDAAIRDEVLSSLTLTEPPPEGMPMPIVMRITARRP